MRTLPVGAAFGHSVNSTINNLKFAFHVSWPWMLVFVPLSVFGNTYFQLRKAETDVSLDVWAGALGVVMAIVEIVSFASIAVSWHRYILKDEVPQSVVERLRMDRTVWLVSAAGRWSIELDGVALGRCDFMMKDAWDVTNGNHAQIFWLYTLFGLGVAVIGSVLLGLTFGAATSGSVLALIIVIAIQTFVNWVLTIWGVTLLTSLCGFFVEGWKF